jgi:hypothetical protein
VPRLFNKSQALQDLMNCGGLILPFCGDMFPERRSTYEYVVVPVTCGRQDVKRNPYRLMRAFRDSIEIVERPGVTGS